MVLNLPPSLPLFLKRAELNNYKFGEEKLTKTLPGKRNFSLKKKFSGKAKLILNVGNYKALEHNTTSISFDSAFINKIKIFFYENINKPGDGTIITEYCPVSCCCFYFIAPNCQINSQNMHPNCLAFKMSVPQRNFEKYHVQPVVIWKDLTAVD